MKLEDYTPHCILLINDAGDETIYNVVAPFLSEYDCTSFLKRIMWTGHEKGVRTFVLRPALPNNDGEWTSHQVLPVTDYMN
jgi:hypothetical protein